MAALFQIRAQFAEVVDLSVENDANRLVFVEDRLVTAGQVDDAQAPNAQSDAAFDKDAFIVWTAMNKSLTHPVNRCFADRGRAIRMSLHDTRDAAHAVTLSQPLRPALARRIRRLRLRLNK